MTTTLTRMARAIGDRLLIQGIDPANMPCSYLDDLARAALEALEPSEHVQEAMNREASNGTTNLRDLMAAMIDHVLNEKGKEDG